MATIWRLKPLDDKEDNNGAQVQEDSPEHWKANSAKSTDQQQTPNTMKWQEHCKNKQNKQNKN